MDLGDRGSGYEQLVEDLQRMRDAVRPNRIPTSRRPRAVLLKLILTKTAKMARRSASKQKWGLAKSLYEAFSGLAGLSFFKTLEASLNASSKEESKWNHVSKCDDEPAAPTTRASSGNNSGGRGGGGGSGNGGGRQGGGGGNRKQRVCYGCGSSDHYISRCPDKNKAA